MDSSGLAVIAACLGAGALLRRDPRLPADAHRALGAFALRVALPALVVARLHPVLRAPGALAAAWAPVSMPWVQFGLAAGAVRLARRPLGLDRRAEGALLLTAGLANTSFVGFPLLAALLGPGALPTALLVDQPGSFLVLSTLGGLAAARYAGAPADLGASLRRAAAFPPLVAFAVAALLAPVPLPAAATAALGAIGQALVPVALVAVGLQLRVDRAALTRQVRPLALGLGLRLVVLPAAVLGLYVGALGQRGLPAVVTVLEAAMAPMITGAALADEAGLDGELAGLMVGVGVPLSLLTVPAWAWLAQRLAAG